MTFRSFRRGYERFLEWICIVLMAALAAEVVAGVVFRYSGHSLVWYDEVATILLAWVTFYGAALAVLKHAHMGVPEIVRMLPAGPTVVLAPNRAASPFTPHCTCLRVRKCQPRSDSRTAAATALSPGKMVLRKRSSWPIISL